MTESVLQSLLRQADDQPQDRDDCRLALDEVAERLSRKRDGMNSNCCLAKPLPGLGIGRDRASQSRDAALELLER